MSAYAPNDHRRDDSEDQISGNSKIDIRHRERRGSERGEPSIQVRDCPLSGLSKQYRWKRFAQRSASFFSNICAGFGADSLLLFVIVPVFSRGTAVRLASAEGPT